MIKEPQKKQGIGIVKKQGILEKQAKFVYLALGSNLGNRKTNIEKAIQLLHKYNVNVMKSSSYYETKSWPNINFPKFSPVGSKFCLLASALTPSPRLNVS